GLAMSVILVISTLVQSYWWLLLWFTVLGSISAFTAPAGGRAIYLWFTGNRAMAMGIRQMGVPLAGVFGALVLAPLSVRFGYPAGILSSAVLLATISLLVLLHPNPE